MNGSVNSSLEALLSGNAYPGRGIVLGRTKDGSKSAVAYFIMGRSENSRNRIFVPTEDGIRTQAYDPSKLEDPSLIIYHPVRSVGDTLIVTNGDQTDTVQEYLLRGDGFEAALKTRSFEPDAPHFTSRISGLLNGDGSYGLSILKSADMEGSACARQFFFYPGLSGVGHFIHTYQCDGNPLPAFVGEPKQVEIPDNIDQFAQLIWNSLHQENKISLFVCFRDLKTATMEVKIINKHGEGGVR